MASPWTLVGVYRRSGVACCLTHFVSNRLFTFCVIVCVCDSAVDEGSGIWRCGGAEWVLGGHRRFE